MPEIKTVYSGPICPRCINHRYTIETYGPSDYKRCIECGRLSAITGSDNLTPLDPQPE